MKRNVVLIDEEKCNGCGDCVSACAEGAIQLVRGKARLVSEVYCDGLGACLGECPEGAITIEEREAADFDEHAVEKHLATLKESEREQARRMKAGKAADHGHDRGHAMGGCPGSATRSMDPRPAGPRQGRGPAAEAASQLTNWPVQIKLAPVRAPYFAGADLLVAADCTAFSHGGFHDRFLAGRTLLIGCPKLDDSEFYAEKLAEIFRQNDFKSVEVAIMEVPCCTGLAHVVRRAIDESGKRFPLKVTRIGVRGDILESQDLPAGIRRAEQRP